MGRTVFVPDGQEPRFPPRCVACGAARPEGSIRFSSARLLKCWHGWFWNYTPARWLWPFGRVTVSVPSCTTCAVRLRRYEQVRFWAFTMALVLTIAIVAVAMVEAGRWNLWRNNDRFKMATFLALVPLMLAFGLDGLLPRTLIFWADWLGQRFTFPSIDSAQEFYELNREPFPAA